MSTIKVTVSRFDPSVDSQAYTTTYTVPWSRYMTVLQALQHINSYEEPINLDFSCRGGLCGRCGVMVNGKPSLACFRVIDEGEDISVEPLAGYEVIRDLVINRDRINAALDAANAEVQTEGEINLDALPAIDYDEWWNDLHRKNMCRECGLCFSACPVYQVNPGSYAGPAVLSQVYLRAFDKLDASDRVLQAVNLGVFNCTECGECSKVCPSYIDHVSCNARLKTLARERGLEPTGR